MLKMLLYPFMVIYRVLVLIRNLMFDLKIKKEHEFDIPIISVGNITVGGTGKTPHAEYILALLKKKFHVAYLSRGYKRKSRGYILSDAQSTLKDIGDEPLQIKLKFPELPVAVCEKRVKGIHRLMKEPGLNIDAIVLDDAFQHRSVKPNINILLVDYNNPISEDSMLPMGRLREPETAKYRANVIIYTKCPSSLPPIEQRIIKKNLNIRPYQDLYFTTIVYGEITPVVKGLKLFENDLSKYTILLVTGIANPQPLVDHITPKVGHIEHRKYSDHYNYTEKDLYEVYNQFSKIEANDKLILTTEKDMVRFISAQKKPDHLLENLYYIPIEIQFLDKSQELFNKKILNYVTENKSNSRLHKK
jgi:tetraacyldisaccharide 4'-kinase